MPTSDVPLRRICVRLNESDCRKLQAMSAATGVAFNLIVREAVHNYVMHMVDRDRQQMDKLNLPKIEIELSELDLSQITE